MEIIRGRLSAQSLVPANTRFNDGTNTVQTTTDGGATWVDNPTQDPRSAPTYRLPPLTTSDPKCDAAEGMVKWIKDTIDGIIDGLDAGFTALTVTNQFLSRLSLMFPPALFVLAISTVAADLVSAGSSALTAAFTTTQYDLLRCIFLCGTDDNGQVSAETLLGIETEIVNQCDTLVAVIVNEILFLTGEVGLSNAGVFEAQTGDCSGCDTCVWFVEFDFSSGMHGWEFYTDTSYGAYGGYSGVAVIGTNLHPWQAYVFLRQGGLNITGISYFGTVNHGGGIGNLTVIADIIGTGSNPAKSNQFVGGVTNVTNAWNVYAQTFTTTNGIGLYILCDTNDAGSIKVDKIRLRGTGDLPVGGVRVNSLS